MQTMVCYCMRKHSSFGAPPRVLDTRGTIFNVGYCGLALIEIYIQLYLRKVDKRTVFAISTSEAFLRLFVCVPVHQVTRGKKSTQRVKNLPPRGADSLLINGRPLFRRGPKQLV